MSIGRPHMSIGEVLSILKAEFPDVSVSKIRFLETEGLVSPERTASGYRKFASEDLDRLRFILKLQRDSFLPLKVIRERLEAADNGTVRTDDILTPAAISLPTAAPAPVAVPAQDPEPEPDILDAGAPVHLNENDLATAAGLDLAHVRALRDFGVLCEHQANGASFFDADDVAVGRVARDFLRLGLEPRHLRTLRRFAEQEAGLFAQLVMPAMHNRRAEVRDEARGRLVELAKLSRSMHQACVRQSLRAVLDGER